MLRFYAAGKAPFLCVIQIEFPITCPPFKRGGGLLFPDKSSLLLQGFFDITILDFILLSNLFFYFPLRQSKVTNG